MNILSSILILFLRRLCYLLFYLYRPYQGRHNFFRNCRYLFHEIAVFMQIVPDSDLLEYKFTRTWMHHNWYMSGNLPDK